MKYKTIGAFKNVQNIGYCKATSDMKVGMGVDIDRVAKTATITADPTTCHYIVTNINDKPEIPLLNEFNAVLEGEFVRADDLVTLPNMEIEFGESEITDDYDGLSVGDSLVFGADGVLTVSADASGNAVYFEILEKTAYMGKGVLALIHVQ